MNTLTLLGTGTSTGVPLIHCSCKVCKSKDRRNHRLRASAWVVINGKSILIDTSTDLRAQAIREKIKRIDAVLYTHPHADHIHGIDELRSFNFVQQETIPLYGNDWVTSELKTRFGYIFNPGPVEGGGIPLLSLQTIAGSSKDIKIQGVNVVPLPVQHGSKEALGYRFNSATKSVAYLTDCSYISDATLRRLEGLDVLVLDCLRLEPHPTHFNLDQALETIERLRPRKTYLTHLGHDFEYSTFKKNRGFKIPRGVFLAYDGLKIRF